jgi:hypothetical protein
MKKTGVQKSHDTVPLRSWRFQDKKVRIAIRGHTAESTWSLNDGKAIKATIPPPNQPGV